MRWAKVTTFPRTRGRRLKRILIVDDHEVVRVGVKALFDEKTESIVFGEASTGTEALRLVRDQDWELIVLDLTIGGRGGLDVLKELKQVRWHVPVLILSMHADEQYVRRAFRAGAAGYVTKGSRREELATALRKVLGGGRYVSAELAEKLIGRWAEDSDRPAHERLSDREFEVLRLIGLGKTIGEIARILSLSDKTISTYRARLLEKMEMKTTAELVRYAVESRLAD